MPVKVRVIVQKSVPAKTGARKINTNG